MTLEIKNLNKHFQGVYAVVDLSFKINAGAITSIIGPNGAGKTTLTNLLSGIVSIDSGSVIVDGQEFSKIKPHLVRDQGITRTFQNVRLFEQMSVLDNLLVVLTQRNTLEAIFEGSKKQEQYIKKADKILKQVGLEGKKGELASNLSYGQRKLLEIGRALAVDTKIILLDEPFAGLFPEMIKTIVDLLKGLREQGKAVVLIEHNMELIRELSDHVIVLDGGKLLAQGAPEEVLNNQKVIAAYLGE